MTTKFNVSSKILPIQNVMSAARRALTAIAGDRAGRLEIYWDEAGHLVVSGEYVLPEKSGRVNGVAVGEVVTPVAEDAAQASPVDPQ